MFPDIEGMITDITYWLPRPLILGIGFDQDSRTYFVAIGDEVWRNSSMESCLIGAWTYWDKKREELR